MSEQNDSFARAVTLLGLVRTPLSVVLRSLEELHARAQDPASPPVAGQLERVRRQAEQVLWLIATMETRTLTVRGDRPPLPEPVLGKVTSADQAFLKRVAAAIDEGIADEAFGVEALAARVAVGRSHLYRRLEALLGCSPGKLIFERRLEHAAQLLAARAGNVSEIAYRVGFKNLSHFSQRFRERYGMTPSAYATGSARVG